MIARQLAMFPDRDKQFLAYETTISLADAAEMYLKRTGIKPTKAIVPLDYMPGPLSKEFKNIDIEPTANQSVIFLLTHEPAIWASRSQIERLDGTERDHATE